jgi:polyhydroxybutyrate depolymerase
MNALRAARTAVIRPAEVFFVLLCAAAIVFVIRQPVRSASPALIVKLSSDVDTSLECSSGTRTFRVHFPPRLESTGLVPAVIFLHGAGGNAVRASHPSFGWREKSDKEGFIAVFPNAMGGDFDKRTGLWHCSVPTGGAADPSADDVAFMKALVDKLVRELPIDPKRVYVTGSSNGALMTHRLGLAMPDVFAAAAPVSGAIRCLTRAGRRIELPRPSEPLPVIIFHGDADKSVPYKGGRIIGKVARADDTVAVCPGECATFWANANGCKSPAVESTSASGATVTRAFSSGDPRGDVVFYTLVGAGHTWPRNVPYSAADKPTAEVSATDLIWEFFKAHPRR